MASNRITFVVNSDIKSIEIYKINYSTDPSDSFSDSLSLKRLQNEFTPAHVLNEKKEPKIINWFIIGADIPFV